jgi:nucleoside-diphosphate-sugar epimerase
MRVLVAGAHNLMGRRVLQKLKEHGHDAIAITSVPAHRDELLKFGAKDVLIAHLLRNSQDIDNYMTNNPVDALIFASGANGKPATELIDPKKITEIDRDAAIEMAILCQKHKVRLLMLSSMGAENPMGEQTPDPLRHFLIMKADADGFIKDLGIQGDNSLHYVIFRPGYMVDDRGTGKVLMREFIDMGTPEKTHISRDDVAEVLVDSLDYKDGLDQKVLYFVEGQTPVMEAISSFAIPAL